MRIDGKVALVSGGASGLGRATAEHLVEAGARVVVADLAASDGQALAEALGERARFAACDVTSGSDVDAAAEAAVAAFGGLHIAVCCAGIATPGRVLGRDGPLPLEAFRAVVEVNLVGTFNVLAASAQRMAEAAPEEGERGVVVVTASVAAYEGQIGQAAYAASKGGIVGLTLPAARDLADRLIRVVGIAPGTFDTPLLAGLPDAARESLAEQAPHPRRLGKPSEFAALVGHIVANPMINGEVIRLDGALRMGPR
ncbi:MAG TPA: SDR family NAD(P)-dependent oxidoreductase [Egibacteraceae bacterium]|nr:SDR family NAD(P)-dependent oxidoreductase [Egibacteraceae bacterium]